MHGKYSKQKTYYLDFKKKVTAHDVGKIICDILGFENTQGEYDRREYVIYKIIDEKRKISLFSIKFSKRGCIIDEEKTNDKMLIKESSDTTIFEDNIENIINRVNKEL